MAKSKGRLNVFQAQLGFFDTVVAASSQAAALRAWGIHQNLFMDGRAQITDDPRAVEAALAHPDTPLKRAVGSNDPFALESTNLPKVPDAPKRMASKSEAKAKPAAQRKPVADRSALDGAEATLRSLDEGRTREEATFRRRQNQLDAERETAQASYVAKRKSAAAAIDEARVAYHKAGGDA